MRAFWLVFVAAGCSSPPATAPPSSPATAQAPLPAAGMVDESKPHHHDAPHGGIVQTAGDLHVEALMMPAGIMFYLSDADQKPLSVDAYSGTAIVKGPGGVGTVDLMAMGDHLHAPATLVQGEPASAVVTLNKDGKAVSASFETQSVGLQSHDHTPLHGGFVSMWGDHHLEYAPKDGEYRVWVTDEHRNAVRSMVTGTIKDDGKVVPLVFDAGTGLLSAKGDGAGTRPVTVDVTVDGASFELGFNAVGGAGG